MPIEFLRKVADAELPMTVTEEGEIDKLRLLIAAGMVTGAIPEPGTPGPAQIHTVTGLGPATLKVRRVQQSTPMPAWKRPGIAHMNTRHNRGHPTQAAVSNVWRPWAE